MMDGEHLELEAESFDAVISRVGLIYFPDQQRALTGMHRVLKPGGKVAAIVYSTADKNQFFSLPVGIIRRRAQLLPPLPGQPGPFSLGSPGVLEEAFTRAGFRDVQTQVIKAPLRLPSAAECVRFERESFGALHQMLAGLTDAERQAAWEEIEQTLRTFEGPDGFEGPCELLVGVGAK
jgi:ubiquinone/menaquinone biosynthesis C-methylase UbiE